MSAESPCCDCGMVVDPGTFRDRQPGWEIYMLTQELWDSLDVPSVWTEPCGCSPAELHPDGHFDEGDLCIGCVERRIGRRLRPDDFPHWVGNDPHPEDSERLRDRRGY